MWSDVWTDCAWLTGLKTNMCVICMTNSTFAYILLQGHFLLKNVSNVLYDKHLQNVHQCNLFWSSLSVGVFSSHCCCCCCGFSFYCWIVCAMQIRHLPTRIWLLDESKVNRHIYSLAKSRPRCNALWFQKCETTFYTRKILCVTPLTLCNKITR